MTQLHADRHDVLDLPMVAEAAARARRLGRPVLASWTRPWADDDAIGFLARAAGVHDRVAWLRPSSGDALVGVGVARALVGSGTDRFRQVASDWRALIADAVVDVPPGLERGGPLLLGGFSFDPLLPAAPLWAGFADGHMVLPEQMLVVGDGTAWLTTNVLVGAEKDTSPPTTADAAATDDQANQVRSLSPAAWQALVGNVARGIRQGQLGLEKVVLARAHQVRATRPLDPIGALRHLAASYPTCTTFLIARGGASFLGATPERLITLRDGTASTMALASSVPRGATPAQDDLLAEQLLRNPKERAEHAVVVGALRDALSQVCTRVVADAQPRVEKLANVQHLLTPIRAQVDANRCVLDLVERLHPTPAVGGFPTTRAMELIRACETLDRGWYAGPIGWLDRDGEGEFVVGIRSALLRGDVATLFTGCGIVADSEPAAEYAESGWKLRPMLAALGVDG